MNYKLTRAILLMPFCWIALCFIILKIKEKGFGNVNDGDFGATMLISFVMILAMWGIYFIFR